MGGYIRQSVNSKYMNKKKVLIVINAVVYNRGSEALIRGLSKIIKKNLDAEITLSSTEKIFSRDTVNIEDIDRYAKKTININILTRVFLKALKVLNLKDLEVKLRYKPLLRVSKDKDYVIVVGADNYDITYNLQNDFYRLSKALKAQTRGKMILFDCSFSERDITETLLSEFKNYDCITVRETKTQANLYYNEIKPILHPDPAFVMEKQECHDYDEWLDNCIGINLSNLILNKEYGGTKEETIKAYTEVINTILDKTNCNILFIPHVMNNADLKVLKEIYVNYLENNRVHIIENENLNAMQLKYIISKCIMYIGARTHSIIAAYSTCVPALAVGYSIKSIGIANDIFGTEKGYVISIADLANKEEFENTFWNIYKKRKNIKEYLEDNIPKYINNCDKILDIFNQE